MRRGVHFLSIALVVALCGIAPPASACNIPVFRFALERWLPDPYRVVLFHKGPLASGDKEIATKLQEVLLADDCPANCVFDTVNLAEELSPRMQELWQAQPNPTLPWLVVRYPKNAKTPRDAFAGPFDAKHANALLDSPARREIAKRLLNGTSAVWLLLESGVKAKDDAKASWLSDYLSKLEKELKLPELTKDPKDKLKVEGLKLKIEFSILRISRTDPAEAMLVPMLLGTEEDLDASKEPIVFSVLGRGLVLHAFLGRGINEKTVAKEAEFLVGACSCEVKAENPGVDLLMNVDWEGRLTDKLAPVFELPPLTGLAPDGIAENPVKNESYDEALRDKSGSSSLLSRLALPFGLLVALVLIGTLALMRWNRQHQTSEV